jgi:hypothetical protein
MKEKRERSKRQSKCIVDKGEEDIWVMVVCIVIVGHAYSLFIVSREGAIG